MLRFIVQIMLLYTVLSVACFLMLRIVVGYTAFEDNVQFLAFKQDYIHLPLWKAAFYTHVFSAFLALFAGFTQFSSDLLREHKMLHRWMGKLYVWNILCINAPVGMVMAIYANGGFAGKTAFILLDILWFFFTWKAYVFARRKQFKAHQAMMIRSYALTLSAITLRSWHVILVQYTDLTPYPLYIAEAWLGFVPNLIAVECFFAYKNKSAVK